LPADVIVVFDLLEGGRHATDAYLDVKHCMLEEHGQIESENRAE
jgi:hypothetical protein